MITKTRNYPVTVAVDFDGVIASYSEGWKGYNVFGEPNQDIIKLISSLSRDLGCRIVIFTTRQDTPELRKYLEEHGVYYDAVNSTKHNPPHTSNKPIYDCFIDDRAVNYNEKQDTFESVYDKVIAILEDAVAIKQGRKKERSVFIANRSPGKATLIRTQEILRELLDWVEIEKHDNVLRPSEIWPVVEEKIKEYIIL